MAARTGNQSTAALSADAAGPAPATMNGLSAALKDASLFNDKFRNVWIFLAGTQSGSGLQLESGGSSSPLLSHRRLGWRWMCVKKNFDSYSWSRGGTTAGLGFNLVSFKFQE